MPYGLNLSPCFALSAVRRIGRVFFLCLLLSPGACTPPTAQPTAPVHAPPLETQTAQEQAWPSTFGIGRPATPEEIAVWDIDVRPDGAGLPPGEGSVADGATLYASQCASCHGATGVEGPQTRLAGRLPGDAFPFGDDLTTWNVRTLGSYWPHATTLFDYILRAMPLQAPGSLTPDEVYALTAFLLHRNNLIAEDAVMDAETLPDVAMPARDRFVPDDRLQYQEVH